MAEFLTLNGKSYTVAPLPTKVGLRTFVRVGKMMGPGFARLFADPELRKKNVAGPEFSEIVADLFTRMDDPHLEDTVETLMNTVMENGIPLGPRWLTEFSGKLATMTKILMFAIEKHFGDFMIASDSPVSLQAAGAETESQKPSQRMKNG